MIEKTTLAQKSTPYDGFIQKSISQYSPTPNLEAFGLQQQKTISGVTPVI